MKPGTWVILVVLVVSSIAVERISGHEGSHWWDAIPGFYSLFGFVGCVAIVLVSKWLGRVLLQREEDYYD